MKRIYFITTSLLALFYFVFSSIPVNASTGRESLITDDIEIKNILQRIEQLPESEELFRKATSQGSIYINTNPTCFMPFEAMWDSVHRRVELDIKKILNSGRIVRNLIFELHNAAADEEFDKLVDDARRGLIDCDVFVEESERIEHNNVLKTVAMIEEGISRGLFPASSHWDVIEDFDIHYKIQQIAGHSQYLAKEYETLQPPHRWSRPFSGTIKGLNQMSENQKMELVRQLYSQLPKFRADIR